MGIAKKIIDTKWFDLPKLGESQLAKFGEIWVDALSQEEIDLLNQSLLTYDHLISAIGRSEIEKMSDEDWLSACRPYGWDALSAGEQSAWNTEYAEHREAMRARYVAMINSMRRSGVAAKSSLLWRLLSKKKAFKHRPPTSYSYPFYSILEDKSVNNVSVSLGGVMSLGSMMNGTGGASNALNVDGISSLVINQAGYCLVDANEAGKALLRAAKDICCNWSDDSDTRKRNPAWSRLKEAFFEGPELMVTHGSWPAWVLKVERCQPRQYTASYFERLMKEEPFFGVQNTGPLDLMCANLGLEKSEESIPITYDDDESVDVLAARKIIEALEGNYKGSREENPKETILDSPFICKLFDAEESKYKLPELNVVASTLQWNISKGAGWNSMQESDIYFNPCKDVAAQSSALQGHWCAS